MEVEGGDLVVGIGCVVEDALLEVVAGGIEGVFEFVSLPRSQQPYCCSTEWRMWKNWLMLASSSGLLAGVAS